MRVLELDLIIGKKNYGKIYNLGYILLGIMVIILTILFIFNYQDYYYIYGYIQNENLYLTVPFSEIEVITSNKELIIDNKKYSYDIDKIIYNDNTLGVYLRLKTNFSDNSKYIYEIKILKKDQKLIQYVIDFL